MVVLEKEGTMKIETRTKNDVTILDLRGRVALGEPTKLLRETINDLVDAGQKNLILNLADVPFVDSGGVGTMYAGLTTARRDDGSIRLLNLTRRVEELMKTIAAEIAFGPFFDDEDEAIASFSE
jgi:anti-sigma B factor antagonist